MAQNQSIFETDLDKNAANYVPLSPLTFIRRSAEVYPNHLSVIHGDIRYNWSESYARCLKLASALQKRGIGKGDAVSFIAPNIPSLFEAHFGVPMSGAILHAINIRLDAENIAFMLNHAESKIIFTDGEFAAVIKAALPMVDHEIIVIDLDDPLYPEGELIGEKNYESFLEEGSTDFEWSLPEDEWEAITLNYTSGTTGDPKGVVYHHRGAYLNAASNVISWEMPKHARYLWTLPMFHCNGWCFPWTVALQAGVNVCLRKVIAIDIFDAIRDSEVSHFCGAPIVLNMLLNSREENRQGINHKVNVMTAGAAPPAVVIEGMERIGFNITHVYGLTETYGPCSLCEWHDEWDEKTAQEQAILRARQGVNGPMLEGQMVADPETLEPVPMDGETMGEVFMRGNNVMKGYLKNPSANEKAFQGGWFHSGDLAVWHPDGYIDIKDRSKDLVISGGENISTLEVEGVLYRHPAVFEAAVVAKQSKKWGETPCAFVGLKEGFEGTTKMEIIRFCRENMARYKVPHDVIFGELPKTSTGKIQKFILRETADGKG